jgi:hypothetical protein
MPIGLYVTHDGWIMVDHGEYRVLVDRADYAERDIQPPVAKLPVEADYKGSKDKHDVDRTLGTEAPRQRVGSGHDDLA